MTWDRAEAVTRKRRTASSADAHGRPVYTLTTSSLPPALVAPGDTSDLVDVGREGIKAEFTLYWPGEWLDLEPTDVLAFRGADHEIVGAPRRWEGSPGGTVVAVARTRG